MRAAIIVGLLIAVAAGAVSTMLVVAKRRPAEGSFATPNDFLGRGTPTFVVGTAGDDRADRCIVAHVDLIRGMLFPDAPVVTDQSIDPAKGPEGWPRNPVVYGGPHVNHLLAALADSLPLQMEQGKLVLGGQVFEGDEYRLIAVVPAREADERGPGYPEFLLYAGTGVPGVAAINAVHHGAEPILVTDTFGRLLAGTWLRGEGGAPRPYFPQGRARRIAWRTVERQLASPAGETAAVRLLFPDQIPADESDTAVIEACMRGLSRAVQRLAIADPTQLSVYIYPDRDSKCALTGNTGDGHAVVASRTLHVARFGTSPGGPLEGLVMHEGTHVLTYESWGPAGSPLLAEGVAVWACGKYGGVALDAWRTRLPRSTPQVADLLGGLFRQMPERQSYPLAGLFVEAVVDTVGIERLRDHLYGATPSTWEAACEGAGTTPRALEAAFRKALGA
ncbi:MAG: hypothetical protein ACE5JM_06310 [Armatimonadota bacterium]